MSDLKTPLVSVVIPTFNRAKLIKDALQSVLNQSYRPIEIIVVDDGSSDNTEEVVALWNSENTTADLSLRFVHQTNRGGNVARNTGITEASGSLIAFLDSDDAWHPKKLAKQIPLFDDPEVGGVYCGVQHMNFDTGAILEPTNRSYPNGHLFQQILIRDITAQTSAFIIRRSVFDTVGTFDTQLMARQDWDMWIRLAKDHKINCAPEPLVFFREHEGERTASNPKKEIAGYRMIREKYADLLAKLPLSFQMQARSTYWKRMSRVHFKHNISRTKGLTYGIGAIACWPLDFDAYAAFLGMLISKNLRQSIHRAWNRIFGATPFAIRSH